jgi:tetratricopeptide (TPR) repeat protein
VECFEELPKTHDLQNEHINARTTLGLYYAQMNYHIQAKQAVEPIVALASEHCYRKRLSQIYTILGSYYYYIDEDLPLAFKYLEESERMSAEAGDNAALFFASFWRGTTLSHSCACEEGLYYLQKALDLNIAAKNLWGTSVTKSCISHFVYYTSGRLDLCHQTSSEAMKIAEQSGDIFSEAYSHTAHGISCYAKGFFEKSIEHLLKAVDIHERMKTFAWNAIANGFLGSVYFEIGQHQKGQDHYSRASVLIESISLMPSWIKLTKIAVERGRARNRDEDINVNALCDYAQGIHVESYDGWIKRYVAEALADVGKEHISDAVHWIEKAIEADRTNGMMFHLGQDYACYADLLKRKGDITKAKENLTKAIEIYKGCGADGWVDKAEKEL